MGDVTREELSAMTDQELLAYEREHPGPVHEPAESEKDAAGVSAGPTLHLGGLNCDSFSFARSNRAAVTALFVILGRFPEKCA